MTFHFAMTIDEVLGVALEEAPVSPPPPDQSHASTGGAPDMAHPR